jgi:anti-sigma regulatory factor (Ser/Thr protein kinase)
MKDLSLHILDVAQNSVSAGAKNIKIIIAEDIAADTLTISIIDDGSGMTPEILAKVTDPFYTTRTTRKVGLGLPLFKQNAEISGGSFRISSKIDEGTSVEAVFGHKHIDRPPLGDIAGVIMMFVGSNPNLDFFYMHIVNGTDYIFDTREVKEVLEDMPLNDPAIIRQLKEMINENLKDLGVDKG